MRTRPGEDKKAVPVNKKAKLILPWDIESYFSETVPDRDEEDEEEEERNEASLARLASADERTKNMSREEYMHWSECRQASFTYRKGKKFREWVSIGLPTDSILSDGIMDLFGFLSYEVVQTLTKVALQVKAEDLQGAGTECKIKTRKRHWEGDEGGLFETFEEGGTPVEPKHIREAFRRLQVVPKKYMFMRDGYAGLKTRLRLI